VANLKSGSSQASLIDQIEADIKGLKLKAQKQNIGVVTEIGDGVARVEGLSDVQYSELLDFGQGVFGLALNLEQYNVGAVIFGDFTKVKEGH
jgi:F-type H+-transporting ATPase subunit alpha